jgi:hypothetical protein
MKATLSQFPVEVQEEIKSTLTCFDSVNISFSNKKFRVSTGLGISSEYPEDFKYYGEIKNSDIYTKEEMKINLKNMYHENRKQGRCKNLPY